MKGYVDEIAWGIFAEKPDELSYNELGAYSVFRTRKDAEAAMKTMQPTMWPWRVAPLRLFNGGFVPL